MQKSNEKVYPKNYATLIVNGEKEYLKQQKVKIKNTFYSLCRNVNSFINLKVNNDLNDIISNITEINKKMNKIERYYFTLKFLTNLIHINKITDLEALYALIQILDPNLEMLEMIKLNEKKYIIKDIFGFYDPTFIKLELNYYRTFDEEKTNKKSH